MVVEADVRLKRLICARGAHLRLPPPPPVVLLSSSRRRASTHIVLSRLYCYNATMYPHTLHEGEIAHSTRWSAQSRFLSPPWPRDHLVISVTSQAVDANQAFCYKIVIQPMYM